MSESNGRFWMESEVLDATRAVWKLMRTLNDSDFEEREDTFFELFSALGFDVAADKSWHPKVRQGMKLLVVLREKELGSKKPWFGIYVREKPIYGTNLPSHEATFAIDRVRYEDEPLLPHEVEEMKSFGEEAEDSVKKTLLEWLLLLDTAHKRARSPGRRKKIERVMSEVKEHLDEIEQKGKVTELAFFRWLKSLDEFLAP